MKKLMFTALLCSSAALAGGHEIIVRPVPAAKPVTPKVSIAIPTEAPTAPAKPVGIHPPIAVPATGAIPTDAPTAPAKPVGVHPPIAVLATGASDTAAVERLLLTAPQGTTVKLAQRTKISVALEDVEMKGVEKMSAEDLKALNEAFSEAAESITSEMVVSVGEVFKDGSRELITTTVLPTATGPLDLHMVQIVEASGRIAKTELRVDDPDMQAAFDEMDEKTRNSLMNSNAGNMYGLPLVVGEMITLTDTLDMQQMMGGAMASALAAKQDLSDEAKAELSEMLQNMKVEPLALTVNKTYKGKNAAGNHVFEMSSSAQPWKMSMKGIKAPLAMDMSMNDYRDGGSYVYRADGLPAAASIDQSMRMKMDMAVTDPKTGEEEGMRMTMKTNIHIELTPVK